MRKGSCIYVWACALMLFLWLPNFCQGGRDSLKPGQLLNATANNTISSPFFTLGFFNLTTAEQDNTYTKWYAGVWYGEIPEFTVVWIANRERPLSDPSSAVLNLTDQGNLVLSDNGSAIWSSSGPSKPASYVTIRADGNLMVFGAENSSEILWQSFDEPGDKWLPGMKLTGNRKLTAWASEQDPFPGLFQLQIRDRDLVLTNNKTSDHGNILGSDTLRQLNISYQRESESFVYYQSFEDYYWDHRSFLQLSSGGQLQLFRLEQETKYTDPDAVISELEWLWQLKKKWPVTCGANAVDVVSGSKWPWASSKCQSFVYRSDVGPCACPLGFASDAEDSSYIYACKRETATACINDGSYSASSDLFIAICTQFPSHGVLQSRVPGTVTAECEKWCRLNCSCTAYAVADDGSCVHWFGDLYNLRIAGNSSSSIFVRLNYQGQFPDSNEDVETDDNSTLSPATATQPSVPGSTPVTKHSPTHASAVAVAVRAVAVVAVAATGPVLCICIARRRRRTNTPNPNHGSKATTEGLRPRLFTYRELREATNNFSDRLGKGAFGSVFKGNLHDGTPVAVKRLEGDAFSYWDQKQFQAEVSTIGVVSHINVVRLLGFCSDDAKRRLLVYEFMPNDSLAAVLFRTAEASVLDWNSRFRIAVGAARGLAYLHESCRYCIIHCDVKPDNILLDADFRPKIADFGLAKLLNRNHSGALTTLRGTFGYMAPEWFSGDPVTSKADVYSFGMVLLEIVSGRRYMRVAESVHEHVRMVAEISRGNGLAALDWRLQGCVQKKQAQRMAVAAVWCIQDDPGARPCMSQVLKLLEGIIAAPRPAPPVPASLLSLVEDVAEVHTFAWSSKQTLR